MTRNFPQKSSCHAEVSTHLREICALLLSRYFVLFVWVRQRKATHTHTFTHTWPLHEASWPGPVPPLSFFSSWCKTFTSAWCHMAGRSFFLFIRLQGPWWDENHVVFLQGMFSQTQIDFGLNRKYFIFLVRPPCSPHSLSHRNVPESQAFHVVELPLLPKTFE